MAFPAGGAFLQVPPALGLSPRAVYKSPARGSCFFLRAVHLLYARTSVLEARDPRWFMALHGPGMPWWQGRSVSILGSLASPGSWGQMGSEE